MLPAAVVVEIAPKDAASPFASTLLSSCTSAVRLQGGCVAGGSGDVVQTKALAIVSWSNADRRAARVEVGIQRAERSEWMVREISFEAADLEIERWRAVGLVVAALVGEILPQPSPRSDGDAPPTAPSKPGPAAPPAAPRPAEAPAPERHSLCFDAGFVLGLGARSAPLIREMTLRPSYVVARSWLATAGVQYAEQPPGPGGISLTWTAGSLGLGITPPLHGVDVNVDARFEAVARHVEATATLNGASDRSDHWAFGGRLAFSAAWMWSRPVGLFVAASAVQMATGLEIRVRGQTLEELPPSSWDLAGGVRLAVP